ncbi:flagellar hook capping FlgD N-terminal domain-containing protein [Silvibacterium sp.]|uniref:flagellar hook capping FlgD N-terminal domain-containing protein n=1 Tax=Silvibacterium sp. TaxID=1964179 RepID=UPI0039E4EB01
MDLQARLMQAQLYAHQSTAARAQATAADDGSSSDSSTTASATITADDFLQLLVTELKNQDPTEQTDPTEYVDQLVQVNSLEQLIQINQNTEPSTTSSGASGSVLPVSSQNSPLAGASMASSHGRSGKTAAALPGSETGQTNLSGSAPSGTLEAAAMRVAGSLSPGAAAASAPGLPAKGSRPFSIPGNPALR